MSHPEDHCHRCGGPNISWYTPGGIWDPVMRPIPGQPWKWDEIICPTCFVSLAGGGTWALIPTDDDGERWTSADERERIKAAALEAVRQVLDDERLPFHYKRDALYAALTTTALTERDVEHEGGGVDARDEWVAERYPDALAARPLQDAAVVLRDLQALWEYRRRNGAL